MRSMHLPSNLEVGLANWTGDTARGWLADLPTMISEAEARWDIGIGEPFEPGGATSYVAPATTADGRRMVYKCTVPHDEAVGESDALRSYRGDGAVQLFANHSETFELLLEECAPGRSLWTEEDDERIDVACSLMRRLWRHDPPDGIVSLAEMTARWAGITERRMITLEVPWVTGPIERGVDLLGFLPASSTETVLLHQDLHPGNILSSAREPWLVIDPKPTLGDPAFDAVQLLVQVDGRTSEPPTHAAVLARLDRIGSALDLDPTRIGLWGIARCAEWSMWSYEHGNTIDAAIEYTWARTLDAILPG